MRSSGKRIAKGNAWECQCLPLNQVNQPMSDSAGDMLLMLGQPSQKPSYIVLPLSNMATNGHIRVRATHSSSSIIRQNLRCTNMFNFTLSEFLRSPSLSLSVPSLQSSIFAAPDSQETAKAHLS